MLKSWKTFSREDFWGKFLLQERFAARWRCALARNFLFFFFYRQFHVDADVAMQLDRNFILADDFDGFGERDLLLIDREALRSEARGNVCRRDRSEELI